MTHSSEELEAIQAAVDRVSAYQDGATEGTTERELRSALAETDVTVSDEDVRTLTGAIEDDPGTVTAAELLG